MYDPHTRESRGFGFVTMENAPDAEACIANLNATDMKGRTITVEKVGDQREDVAPALANVSYLSKGPSWTCSHAYSGSVLRTAQAFRW